MPAFLLVLFAFGTPPVRAHDGLGLPRLRLNTENGAEIVSRQRDLRARLTIDPNGGPARWRADAELSVRGRGNSTWDMPKRPYKLNLDKARSLLGMPPDREWSLLANFADKTLLRNLLANFMGSRLKFDYTPRNHPVLLNLNGTEVGVYVLVEEVKVTPERLNLRSDDVTGGYLIELDQRKSDQSFVTSRGIPYSFAVPKHPNPRQRAYISTFVQAAEDSLARAASGEYARLIDVPSFIDWYLVNEILKNSDAGSFSSIYLHKSAGEKLKMGPIWDFDLAAGNTDYTDARVPEGWWIRTQSPWFIPLFNDPAFAVRVRARWRELPALGLDAAGLGRYLDRASVKLSAAAAHNFSIWDYLGTYVWPNAVVTGSYAGEVDFLKKWLTTRIEWMNQELLGSEVQTPQLDAQ